MRWNRGIGWTSAGAALALCALAGCQRGPQASPGETKPGMAQEKDEAPGERSASCGDLPSADDLRKLLREAPTLGDAGGLAGGRFEWAAIVNRSGHPCAVVVSTDDPTAAWPGSRAIALAKAYTANAFSTDNTPLSTARLYTLAQPGHSLFGAGAANPFNPLCLAAPGDKEKGGSKVCGGTIVFGGGLPLYRGKTKVGGLGASGDTACADHEIAKRIRDKAGLNPPGGAFADDITYSSADKASIYTHPLCPNTWRNGKRIGDEPPASGY